MKLENIPKNKNEFYLIIEKKRKQNLYLIRHCNSIKWNKLLVLVVELTVLLFT